MKLRRSALVGFLLSCVALIAPAQAETTTITFVLTNDIYKVDNDGPRGGFARLNAVVKSERAKGGHVVYAHAGDLISPSLLSSIDKGEHTIALINLAPPDIFTPGNHEYDFGPDVFAQRMKEARFPVYAANLRNAEGKPVDGIKDHAILDIGGVKVGLVGMTADDSPVKSSPGESLKFLPTVATTVAEAKALREAGADLVVAVVHANRQQDREIFDSRAADIILSGDDHDLALFFDGRTVLAESKEEAEFVTAIDVKVDVDEKDGKRSVSWYPNFRIIDTATVTPDPETQAAVDKYNAELSKELDVAVGTTTTTLDSRKATVRTSEAAIGNLIADAMRAAVSADLAITNGGGIRGNKEYAPGTQITRRDILAELPFGNRTVKIEVSGDAVWAALENGLSMIETSAGRFPQISGFSFEADLSRPAGQRVTAIMVGGAPIDRAKTYTLATNDYMFGGGDGYTMFRSAKPLYGVRDAKLLTNDVMAYIDSQKSVAPKVEGRIILKP